ncbi:M23 family metallopeptidase [Phorcysia thermohydrogeniphila]|uniref:Murein DD-endopeptidase MepM/ murein hydrolase activator NlpD n=1 Tax=Phorcysia thermohydrogeniphila TaxID=936138 RepID=A0A4R1GP31_9BACT|nr:M23 family metallopeptidase [Phorcysia thermohydrogeniphila]TCK06202.1 murein DD-endopeptidase MepM/ murein hydrolase activator NlpD [Phorcysia thermohydrogeniphila]
MGKNRNDRLQVIVIEDELANRVKRFFISKKLIVFSLLFSVVFTLSVTVYAVFITYKSNRYYSTSTKELKELRSKVAQLEKENANLRSRVASLEQEKEETIEELARRIEIIDSIMKRVGIEVSQTEGEGGLALPLDKLLEKESSGVNFSDVIPGIDYLIENFKTTPLGYPTYGRITSDFGLRRNPVTGRLEFHLGVDIADKWGTPVRAPADGVVIKAGWCGLMGKCLEIRHNRDIVTYYGHLAKLLVKKGDRVERGQIIGLMGNSGRSTGPHLHYTIKFRNRIMNPHDFMEVLANAKEERVRKHRRNQEHLSRRFKN